MLKPGDLHRRCGWLQMQLRAALHWYKLDYFLSFHILRLTFFSKVFVDIFLAHPLPKYSDAKNVLPRSCSLRSVQQQRFLFPFPTSWLPVWSSWPVEYTQALLITVWECVCRRVHIPSFLCIILQNRQDHSQPRTEIMFISRAFFFFPHRVGAGITSGSWSRLGGNSSLTHFLFALLPLSQKSKWKDNGRKGLSASCRGLVSWKQIGRRAVRPPSSSHRWSNANVSEKGRIFKGLFPNPVSLTKYSAVKNARASSSGLVPFFRFLFCRKIQKQ